MKTVILYASVHHGNTKRVAEALAGNTAADLINVVQNPAVDLAGYDLIGFASGAYFGVFHQTIKELIEKTNQLAGKKVFLLGTCGVGYKDYAGSTKKQLKAKGAVVLGSFQYRCYDTYGILGKIGGIAKKHPDQRDLENAALFFQKILQAAENE